jgi:hypothetical protein
LIRLVIYVTTIGKSYNSLTMATPHILCARLAMLYVLKSSRALRIARAGGHVFMQT